MKGAPPCVRCVGPSARRDCTQAPKKAPETLKKLCFHSVLLDSEVSIQPRQALVNAGWLAVGGGVIVEGGVIEGGEGGSRGWRKL